MCPDSVQEPEKEHETPRVSPYRLAAHLGSAFAIYSILVWTTLSLAFPKSPSLGLKGIQLMATQSLKGWALPVAALIAVTGMSGDVPMMNNEFNSLKYARVRQLACFVSEVVSANLFPEHRPSSCAEASIVRYSTSKKAFSLTIPPSSTLRQ